MAIMRCDHPDILEFVHVKSVEGSLKNFNVSVGLTDDFMREVVSGSTEPWTCNFGGKGYPLRRINRGSTNLDYTRYEITDVEMTASEVFEEIVTCAWKNGEPGCVFLDKVNETNPVPGLGRIEASNPCGEQFLHDGDVCNLGALNLSNMLRETAAAAGDGLLLDLDEEKLARTVSIAIRMLDNAIETFHLPVERVREMSRRTRRCGLGVMGFAEYLIKRRIPYDSGAALREIDRVMGVIRTTANEASKLLGAEKGVFPAYRLSIYSASGEHYRNAFRTCVAPTGTTYMIVTPSITGGIEPVFLFAHKKKNILGGMTLSYDVHYLLEAELRRCGLWKEDIIERITKKGTVRDIQEIPEEIRRIFVCSHDIKPRDHVMVQAAFQQHIDNSISKTCNFPEDATVGDVVEAYKLAWQMGCKGLTVYRNNSRLVQVLESHEEHERKIIAAGDSSSAFVPLNIFGKQSSSSLRESSSSQEGSPSSPVGSDVCEKRSLPSTDGGDEPSPTLKRFRSMLAPPQSSSSSSCSVTECPHCVGSGRLERSEGCVKCAVCGWGLCG